MSNLISFINSLLSYLVVYIVFAVCIVLAVLGGIALRKNKNKKDELVKAEESKAEDDLTQAASEA
jgi:hypothetical protein